MDLQQTMNHSMGSDDSIITFLVLGITLLLLFFVFTGFLFLYIIGYFNRFQNHFTKKTGIKNNLGDYFDSLEDSSNNRDDKNLPFLIDDQYYQRKKIISTLSDYPEGILQSELPRLTNLSKTTISRRIHELMNDDIILQEPSGRSNLLTLK